MLALADGDSGATLRLFDQDGVVVVSFSGQDHWESDQKGEFWARALVPGTYTAAVEADRGRTWSQQIEIRAIPVNKIVLR